MKLLTTSQLGRFCTDTHKLINSSNHNLEDKQTMLNAEDNFEKKFKSKYSEEKIESGQTSVILKSP